MEKFLKAWDGFIQGKWCEEINVREFIQKNYSPYIGDESFLCGATDKTKRLFSALEEKLKEYDNVWFTGDAYDMVSHMTDNITPVILRGYNAAGAAYVGSRRYLEAEDKSQFNDMALQPVYLKKTQAEREREERLSREANKNE